VLKARKLLAAMAPGERLEVITTDPMSVVDMPVFCAQAGHRIVAERKRADDFVFVIVRGGPAGP
jgi:tRNA 2-thiouridine synthesizing protein A